MNKKQISGLGDFLSAAITVILVPNLTIENDIVFIFVYPLVFAFFRLYWYLFVDKEADDVEK